MQGRKMLISLAILFTQTLTQTQAQTSQTDTLYIHQVDSIANLKPQPGIGPTESIGEGDIITVSVTYDSLKKANDTTFETKGGFGIQTLHYKKEILRIQYHDNANYNLYKDYYFQKGQLVYAHIRLEDEFGTGKILYSGEEWYKDGKVIYKKSSPKQVPEKYSARVSFSWAEHGNSYYQQEVKDHSY